tara:strand:+ start:2236 stop:3174 length:939 start_codon:yes stop_codon:yes gene_type:complete
MSTKLTDDEYASLQKMRSPFLDEEVEWRMDRLQGQNAVLLAYLNGRSVMKRLDDCFGPEGWQNKLEIVDMGGAQHFVASIGIKLAGEWIWKTDAAGHRKMHGQGSDLHETKAGASDSLKRAAVLWGMGRNLYLLGTTKAPFGDGWPPNNIPRHMVCTGKGGATKGKWCKVPSIREMQRHMLTVGDEIRGIADPGDRRLARIRSICARLKWGKPPQDMRPARLTEAASAIVKDGEFSDRGTTLPPWEMGAKRLQITSQRALRWFENEEIDVKISEYESWKKMSSTKAAPTPPATGEIHDAQAHNPDLPWSDNQ